MDKRQDYSSLTFKVTCFSRRRHIKRGEPIPEAEFSGIVSTVAQGQMLAAGWGQCKDKDEAIFFCPFCWKRVRVDSDSMLVRTEQDKIKWYLAWEEMSEAQRLADLRRAMRAGEDIGTHANMGGRPKGKADKGSFE